MSETRNARSTAHIPLGETGGRFRLGKINADARVALLWGRPNAQWFWRGARGAPPSVLRSSYLTRGTNDPNGAVSP